MSAAAETSRILSAPAQRRVTDLRAIVDAMSLSVRIADNVCCAEFATPTGLLKVLLPADRFVAAARGARDANGRPFPPLRESHAEAQLRLLETRAEVVPMEARVRVARPPIPDRDEKCAAAWARLKATPGMTLKEAAEPSGIPHATLSAWLLRHHPDAWARLKRRNRGIRKVEAAALRGPVLKPGGRIL